MSLTSLKSPNLWLGLGVLAFAGFAFSIANDGATAGQPIVSVQIPTLLSATAQIGQEAYATRCAACHGINAVGQVGIAPPLVHKIYEPSHHGDASFMRAAFVGVTAHHWPFGDMPPVEGITEPEVLDIIAYLRELQRANGIH